MSHSSYSVWISVSSVKEVADMKLREYPVEQEYDVFGEVFCHPGCEAMQFHERETFWKGYFLHPPG
jgi:hypothetical protein